MFEESERLVVMLGCVGVSLDGVVVVESDSAEAVGEVRRGGTREVRGFMKWSNFERVWMDFVQGRVSIIRADTKVAPKYEKFLST